MRFVGFLLEKAPATQAVSEQPVYDNAVLVLQNGFGTNGTNNGTSGGSSKSSLLATNSTSSGASTINVEEKNPSDSGLTLVIAALVFLLLVLSVGVVLVVATWKPEVIKKCPPAVQRFVFSLLGEGAANRRVADADGAVQNFDEMNGAENVQDGVVAKNEAKTIDGRDDSRRASPNNPALLDRERSQDSALGQSGRSINLAPDKKRSSFPSRSNPDFGHSSKSKNPDHEDQKDKKSKKRGPGPPLRDLSSSQVDPTVSADTNRDSRKSSHSRGRGGSEGRAGGEKKPSLSPTAKSYTPKVGPEPRTKKSYA